MYLILEQHIKDILKALSRGIDLLSGHLLGQQGECPAHVWGCAALRIQQPLQKPHQQLLLRKPAVFLGYQNLAV